MREIGSREFQLTYQRLTEPVKVITRSGAAKTIGYFYPGPIPPGMGSQPTMFSEPEPAPPGFQPPVDAKEEDSLDKLL